MSTPYPVCNHPGFDHSESTEQMVARLIAEHGPFTAYLFAQNLVNHHPEVWDRCGEFQRLVDLLRAALTPAERQVLGLAWHAGRGVA